MKKILASLVLGLALVAAVSAAKAEPGLYVTPVAQLDLGLGNYFRGGGLSAQAIYDIGGIGAGLEVKFDYDSGFSNANIPVFAVLSFGPSFYLMAGQTIGLGNPTLVLDSTHSLSYTYGSFPNTYGLGFKAARIPLGFAKLAIGSELFYTVATSTDTSAVSPVYNLIAMFAGIKANLFAGLEFKL